jgi:hypothetical protein
MKKYKILFGIIDLITLNFGAYNFIFGLGECIRQSDNDENSIISGYGFSLIALFFLIRNWRKQNELS